MIFLKWLLYFRASVRSMSDMAEAEERMVLVEDLLSQLGMEI